MKVSISFALCVFSTLVASMSAQADPLKIVNVSAPAINCVFNSQCKVVVEDSTSTFSWPSVVTAPTASAQLQSRTFAGMAGKTAYLYRVTALKGGSTDCVMGLVMDFGPNAQLDFNKSGMLSDVFVVTKGGLGATGVKSADRVGSTITFNFTQAICNTVIQGSYFFGLAATTPPKSITVKAQVLASTGKKLVDVQARVPTH